jgi:hypothetical protein
LDDDNAYDAYMKNQKKTADIARKYLTKAVYEKISLLQ